MTKQATVQMSKRRQNGGGPRWQRRHRFDSDQSELRPDPLRWRIADRDGETRLSADAERTARAPGPIPTILKSSRCRREKPVIATTDPPTVDRVIRTFACIVPEFMRAVVYRGIDDLRVETVPVPPIQPGEILVKVSACGVCPTDIKKIHQGTLPGPRIYGHETAGTIVRVGSAVRGFRAGERVGLHHHVPCLHCHFCRHRAFAQCETYRRTGVTAGFEPAGGGYAEYVRVMDFCLPGAVKIPARNSFLEGALLEPVNTVLKGVEMLPLIRGDVVLVAGAGPIGLLFIQLLVLRGARVIASDLLPKRRERARQAGASFVLDGGRPDLVEELRQISNGIGLDAAVVCVPVDAVVTQAQAALRGGGITLLFAHTVRGKSTPVDLGVVCVDEKTLSGSYSSDFTLQRRVARLVFSRKLDVRPLVTHTFPLEQTAAAVALAADPTTDSLKVVVENLG